MPKPTVDDLDEAIQNIRDLHIASPIETSLKGALDKLWEALYAIDGWEAYAGPQPDPSQPPQPQPTMTPPNGNWG